MKSLKYYLQMFFILLIGFSVKAQMKYSKVKIFTDEKHAQAQKYFVYGALQVDHCHFEDGAFVIEIDEEKLEKLKASSYNYKIVIPDLAENFRLTNDVSKFYESDTKAITNRLGFTDDCQKVSTMITTPVNFTPGSMGGYYTYAEMVTKIGYLFDTYPGIVDTFSIGRSIEDRDIWCVKISDNVLAEENEPEVMFNALQHCREAISGTSEIFFMQYLCENYFAGNTKVQQLVNNREIFIIPCVNPDGYVWNQTTNPGGGGGWRKNRRPLGTFVAGVPQYGVDLNRNYNADWGNCSAPVGGIAASCGSSSKTSANETYWGTGPFSEPETQAIRDFTAAHNFRMSIDQHSEGSWNTVPQGRTSLHPGPMPLLDSMFLYGFASSAMASYNCHRMGNNLQTLNYEVAGGNKDWMFQGQTSMVVNPRKIYSYTSEAGGGSFWPTASKIIPLAKGLTFQYLQAALAAGSYVDLQDADDVELTSLNGTFNYNLRRIGILDANVTVSIIPIQNIGSVGSAVTLPAGTMANYYSTASGGISYSLPATIGNGQLIKFIWRVTTDGVSVDEVVTKIYNPTTVFADDMESGTVTGKWTVANGFDYGNVQSFNGSKSLSESPTGNYTKNSIRTATIKNTINLSTATAAYFSFWVNYRAENCLDFMRIQISTDGGANYTPLCAKNTISENDGELAGLPALTGIHQEWTRELVDLSSYVGPGMNNIKLQYYFSSNDDDVNDDYYRKLDDGFYIDNVKLISSTNALVALPVQFISFDGQLLANKNVELKWNAAADDQHDYFEVQRSVDKNNFITLGKILAAPPCVFVDPSAKPGNNYYRIKQVDKNGTVSYSKVINIIYNSGKINYLLYPNPVTDVLNLRLSSDKKENYTVSVTDVLGREVINKKVSLDNFSGNVSINFSQRAAQVYILTIRNESNEIIATEKIIKQ